MAYAKTTWVNDSPPPINEVNLNKIEQGIDDAHAGDIDDSVLTPAKLSFGTWEKVGEITVVETCTFVEFTGLDINTDGFYKLFVHTHPAASGALWLYAFAENDTTLTNYITQTFFAQGIGAYTYRYNHPGAAYTAGSAGVLIETLIARDINGIFRTLGSNSMQTHADLGELFCAIAKTAAIANLTTLRLQSSAANGISAGSRFILCKLRTK